jgi:hypothetical protein
VAARPPGFRVSPITRPPHGGVWSGKGQRRDNVEIVMKKVSELTPYDKNAKKHDAAQVDNVANSIKRFGWQQPIVIDDNGVVVIGHCRLMAAKKLGLSHVPVTVASGLTDLELRELRIADNKTNESPWDFALLDEDTSELLFEGFDFDYGFEDEPEEEAEQEPEKKENARLQTDYAYNLPFVDLDRTEGRYQMPIIKAESHIPDSLIGFNYALSSDDKNAGIHFYVDDYQFERIWTSPERYIEVLRPYDCVLTPDFSLYMDMPYAMKIWNVFRSRLIGQMCQDAGLAVIPTVSWAERETFDFCFDGLPGKAVLSISTIGVKNSPEAMQIWRDGVAELIRRKQPKTLLVYGGKVDFDYGNINVLYFANTVTERMKKAK